MIRRVRCRLLGHFPDFIRPYRANAGIDFATCLYCEKPILKQPSEAWRRPRRGMRIVWRAPEPTAATDGVPAGE
jgi:hypothetical protein